MWSRLAGVPGKLTSLITTVGGLVTDMGTALTNLTSVLGKLPTSGRAVSNTAWTDARATYLDLLNSGAISGQVKSVQIVTVTMTATSTANTTVSAVNTAKTIVLECSREHGGTSSSTGDALLARHTLTTTTNLHSRRNATAGVLTCQVALIEIY